MREEKAERLLEQMKPELQIALSTAPSFGIMTIALISWTTESNV